MILHQCARETNGGLDKSYQKWNKIVLGGKLEAKELCQK